jgi:hypothetical protein
VTSDGLREDGWHVILQEVSREETALLAGNEDKMAAHILELQEYHFGS